MEKLVDARGLSCPSPVVLTKQALDQLEDGVVTTVVDNRTALENVIKLAHNLACEVNVEERAGEYYIHIEKSSMTPSTALAPTEGAVLMVTSNTLGKGDEKLGKVLMKSFFYTLTEVEGVINTAIFMNSGVFLTTEGSEIIEYLSALEQDGVKILSCGTCLDYYQLKDRLVAGTVTNMYNIVEALAAAHKVITI